jgi:hypothetical protein
MNHCENCGDDFSIRQYCHTCYSQLEEENYRLRRLLERHLCDNPKNKRDYCNCKLCQDTRDALVEE